MNNHPTNFSRNIRYDFSFPLSPYNMHEYLPFFSVFLNISKIHLILFISAVTIFIFIATLKAFLHFWALVSSLSNFLTITIEIFLKHNLDHTVPLPELFPESFIVLKINTNLVLSVTSTFLPTFA